MKRIIFLLLAIIAITPTVFAQTSLYENPEFDVIAKDHKIIAIVPFKTQVKLRPKQMKDMTDEQLERLEKAEGESLQTGMFSWFLKRKKRGKLTTLEIQQPSRTNALLKKQGIDYSNLYEYTTDDLAKILEVDAVISGDYETNKPMSDGASIALGLLVGFWGSTNTAIVNMSVNNGADGTLLWNYNKKVRGGLGSSPEDLVNVLMRKASRRLAYTKND
ncbi:MULTISPECIES: hypothetical protein [Dokdonia]|jgi:hypothetical protein|uniref:Secreted protein n=2 Tax=Dokdonia TaxID=326319 RepID=A0A0A2GVH9_9FLAO|nr:hypothetical protein [Dokdonia donghaensis]ANH61719.1 hypothetical protein I597_2828 [Dokdonia donghaensis DSW-1]KGO06306.1 hypothetical protein NV36_05275 [Dokdonia donghaensis DSW-1]MDE0598128.1 hypothetical protein [Dokdonia donghaensis]